MCTYSACLLRVFAMRSRCSRFEECSLQGLLFVERRGVKARASASAHSACACACARVFVPAPARVCLRLRLRVCVLRLRARVRRGGAKLGAGLVRP